MNDQPSPRRKRPRLGAEETSRLQAELDRIASQERAAKEAKTGKLRARGNSSVNRNDAPDLIAAPRVTDVWAGLPTLSLDPAMLDRNLVITARRRDPAHAAFDVLRARLVQALADHGWNRVGITSPTRDCGKTFTALNLAVTLSRYDNCRTILMDMDMRNPSLAKRAGISSPGSMGDYLRGDVATNGFLHRIAANDMHIGANLALGLNGRIEPYAAELFQQPRTTEVLEKLQYETRPDVLLFDLPPALAQDDVIAFRPHFDCILMVIGGGITKPADVRESVRRLGEDKPVVGIVLNRGEGEGVDLYGY